jgi:hypothetical protein
MPGRGLARQRADDVVGLDALDHQQRPAQGADAVVQRFDLRTRSSGIGGRCAL